MGDIAWLKDVPEGTILFNSDGVLVLRSTFDRLSDYTRSQPTAPSVGRIWKRAHKWSAGYEGGDPNWFVWVARPCTDPDHADHTSTCREMFGRKALVL